MAGLMTRLTGVGLAVVLSWKALKYIIYIGVNYNEILVIKDSVFGIH